ncbi:MAG: hypothetical protein QOH88_2497 [Verrucomicrobiota bacterium]|jgi:hypothetical protein
MKAKPGEQLAKCTVARGPMCERVTEGNDTEDGKSNQKGRKCARGARTSGTTCNRRREVKKYDKDGATNPENARLYCCRNESYAIRSCV